MSFRTFETSFELCHDLGSPVEDKLLGNLTLLLQGSRSLLIVAHDERRLLWFGITCRLSSILETYLLAVSDLAQSQMLVV